MGHSRMLRLPLSEIATYENDPFTYNAQYLQVPLDDIGNLFERHKLVLSTERPPLQSVRTVISVDAALKGDVRSDFNAIAVICTNGVDYWILDVMNFHADVTVLCAKVRECRKRYGSNTPILFEAKANGVAAAQILRREMSGVLEVSPTKDKLQRANLVKYLFDSMNVKFSLRGFVWSEVQSQFVQFPHGQHDDIVDSVVQGIAFLQGRERHLQNVANQQNINSSLSRPRYGGSNGSSGYSSIFGR